MIIKLIKGFLKEEALKKKVIFTLLLLLACRIGAHVPVPGINGRAAVALLSENLGIGGQNLFQLMDVFSGGAFAQMTVVALGVMPYISASIILQLVTALIPSLQREVKENGEAGRKKQVMWTRFLTLALAFFQSGIFAKYTLQMDMAARSSGKAGIILTGIAGTPLYFLLFMVTMTTGTLLLMWIGEQITAKGIGNGMSLIITLGILSSLPRTLSTIYTNLSPWSQDPGALTYTTLFVLMAIFVTIVMATILVNRGERRILLENARSSPGKVQTKAQSYLPVKVNAAGVMPVIFASSVLMFPATIGKFFGVDSFLSRAANFLLPGTWTFMFVYVLLIFFFTYFWIATQVNPEKISSDLKKQGSFIPGIGQGSATTQYLESVFNRITFVGAITLSLIAILPNLIGKLLNVDSSITYFFGGTSLLIMVGVILDTASQIESQVLTRSYGKLITLRPGL